MTLHRLRPLLLATALTAVLAACAPADSAAGTNEMEGMDHGEDSQEAEGAADTEADAGGHSHEEEAPAPVEGAEEIAVSATSFAFEPDALTITAGEPVNLALTSEDILHDFVVEDEGFHLSAETGETSTGALTIDEPGTYTVYCSVPRHRETGMEAILEVEAA